VGGITKITFRNALYLGQSRLEGLHNGIGPPSNEGTIGAATATYVQTRPTIRNNILTARFMDCFSLRAGPLGAETLTAGIITESVDRVHKFVLTVVPDFRQGSPISIVRGTFLVGFQQLTMSAIEFRYDLGARDKEDGSRKFVYKLRITLFIIKGIVF